MTTPERPAKAPSRGWRRSSGPTGASPETAAPAICAKARSRCFPELGRAFGNRDRTKGHEHRAPHPALTAQHSDLFGAPLGAARVDVCALTGSASTGLAERMARSIEVGALGALVGMAALVSGCASCPSVREGHLTGRWVLVAGEPAAEGTGEAAGLAAQPTAAQPLAVSSASPCFGHQSLRSQFGDECKVNDSEAAGSSAMDGGIPDGNTPTPGEVHWFCDRRTVVRVVLARCATADEFKVRQIAISVGSQ